MTDPAVEAAYRAWPHMDKISDRLMIAAAREALKPIRELHRKASVRALGFADDRPHIDVCAECSDIGLHVPWPCETAKLIYADEEL